MPTTVISIIVFVLGLGYCLFWWRHGCNERAFMQEYSAQRFTIIYFQRNPRFWTLFPKRINNPVTGQYLYTRWLCWFGYKQ